MNQLSLFLNDESSNFEIRSGETWQSHILALPGHLSIVMWSQAPAAVDLRVKTSLREEISEQFGRVTSFMMEIDAPVDIVLTVALNRPSFLHDDRRTMQEAIAALKEKQGKTEHDVKKKMAVILRASMMTTKVATFLADQEEFCVVKRKAWMKGKKLPTPMLVFECAVQKLVLFLQVGTRQWRQSSGSFSTMMRFIQRSKDLFKWHAQFASLFLRRSS